MSLVYRPKIKRQNSFRSIPLKQKQNQAMPFEVKLNFEGEFKDLVIKAQKLITVLNGARTALEGAKEEWVDFMRYAEETLRTNNRGTNNTSPSLGDIVEAVKPLLPTLNEEALAQKILKRVRPPQPAPVAEMVETVYKKIKLPRIPSFSEIFDYVLEQIKVQKLAIDDIKGLRDMFRSLQSRIMGSGRSGGGGSETLYYDLSSQTNGVLKTFTIPANMRVIWLGGTDAPGGQYRQTTDYTVSGTTLTLTSEVAAPTTGATLHLIYTP